MSVSRKLLVLAACILVLAKSSKGVCPDADIIEPCTCSSDNFVCEGSSILNYKNIINRISIDPSIKSKTFLTLTLSNSAITEIVDDEFGDLSFTEINIKNANNLKRIHAHAFTKIADKVEVFQQSGPSLLGEEDIYVPELFQALSSLTNARSITLVQTKIKYIPDKAFSSINQNKLVHLEISSGMISKVGNYAFYYLNSLKNLHLENQQLNHIATHAFDLEQSSTNTLDINLNDNLINDSGIEVNAFVGSRRPITLNLANNVLTHLNESIFKPILAANSNTKINVLGNAFRCDCLNEWLVLGKSLYISQVTNAVCTDSTHNNIALFNLKRSDFDKCHEFFE